MRGIPSSLAAAGQLMTCKIAPPGELTTTIPSTVHNEVYCCVKSKLAPLAKFAEIDQSDMIACSDERNFKI